jgi:hypothetical protein
MNAITAFGFVAVLTMLIAYALEDRDTIWTLVFAVACFASAVYGYLAGTLPFAFVEAVWGLVALRKWTRRT